MDRAIAREVDELAMFSEAGLVASGITNNQDKIRYLKRYVWLDREIDRKVDEIDRWRSKMGKVTAVYSNVPKGGGSIYSGGDIAIINKIVDLEREVNVEIDNLIELRRNIKAIIESVQDYRERQLLQYRYLDGRTFEWIAAEMYYSWRQIHRLHSKALNVVILCHI